MPPICGEVISLVNLAGETRFGLASVLYTKSSCYHGQVNAEENNSHFCIFFSSLSLIWRHSHEW